MVKSFFTREEEREIVEAIQTAERVTSGEIRVHLRAHCRTDVVEEATRQFKKLGLHKTRQRNGILIFVAPKSRKFAILADEGINQRVAAGFWDRTRDGMMEYFKKDELKNGILAGIRGAGEELRSHFPRQAGDTNELPDTITED